MSRQQEILRQVGILTLIGIGLFGIAFFAPDANAHQGAFYQAALQTSWRHILDLPAVWSSIKIILCCVGLFLVIESAGTMLSVMKMKSLALLVFLMQIVPGLGLLCGGYYLVKSVL